MSDAKKSDEVTTQESHITGEGAKAAAAPVAAPQESHITGEKKAKGDLADVTTLESHITVGDPR